MREVNALALLAQDCNLVLYKQVNITTPGPGTAIFSSGTYGQGQGCQFIVTSQQGGTAIVIDSANNVLFGKQTALQQDKLALSYALMR